MPQRSKETAVDGNNECSLDQLANNLPKDTGISQSVLPQVFYQINLFMMACLSFMFYAILATLLDKVKKFGPNGDIE